MGSVNTQGITKYHCEISYDKSDLPGGRDIEKTRFELDQKVTIWIQALLGDIHINAAPQSYIASTNSISYMLKLEEMYQSATYVWCQQLPKGWEQLQELVDLMIGLEKNNNDS